MTRENDCNNNFLGEKQHSVVLRGNLQVEGGTTGSGCGCDETSENWPEASLLIATPCLYPATRFVSYNSLTSSTYKYVYTCRFVVNLIVPLSGSLFICPAAGDGTRL